MKWERTHERKETIISKLQTLAKDLGKPPTWVDCMKLSDIALSRLTFHFGTFNKALVAAGLPVNRERTKRTEGYTKRGGTRSKYRVHKPVFTLRICNICDRKFQAEDNMRSCPVCTTTKKAADNRGGLSDTAYNVGYLR